MTKTSKQWKAWGGFANGTLDVWNIHDGFGGTLSTEGYRRSPAIFTTRREARQRFKDVRPVLITLAPPKRKAKKA